MPKAQGFARGDLEAAFPLDDKFLALRGSVSVERYYQATGVYFHIAAATWREAERKPASKVCPDAGDIVADLIAVGLLDSDGCVTRRAYMHTVGRAKAHRRTASDRQARNRAGMSRVTPRDSGVTNAMSPPARGTGLNGTDTDSALTGEVPARDDIVDDYYRLTTRWPSAGVTEWLERLAAEFGYDPTSRRLADQFRTDPNSRTLLGRVENDLKSAQHGAAKEAADREKERQDKWAKDHKVTPEQAEETRRKVLELQSQWSVKEMA